MSENNDLDDRLSRRFDNESPEDKTESSHSSDQSQSNQNAQTSQKAQNVKKEWNVRSFYLDDNLETELTTMFKRLDLELSEADMDVDVDVELQKTRHFYPLIVELGLERLEEMDITEITDQLESKDR